MAGCSETIEIMRFIFFYLGKCPMGSPIKQLSTSTNYLIGFVFESLGSIG